MPSGGEVTLLEVRDPKVGYEVAGASLFAPRRMSPIVWDASVALEAGQTIGIAGESGAGKSTQRRTVSRDLARFEPGLSRGELAARPVAALRLVGLSADFAGRYSMEPSGGLALSFGIARALIGGLKMIVSDQPVSALDVSIQAQMVNLLMYLQGQMGLALVFISHNLSAVWQISQQIMVMFLGRLVELAPRDAFYARPLHLYARALMAAVPKPDPVREKGRRAVLAGEVPSVLHLRPGCVFARRCPVAVGRCHVERPELCDFGGRQAACDMMEG